MTTVDVKEEPFPARSRGITGVINDVPTEIGLTQFSEKILLTISQGGRLSQWIQVPLTGSGAEAVEMTLHGPNRGLLPATHLTPKTILGGGGGSRETLGQLYAAQIASFMSLKSPEDRRILVLGLGLEKVDLEREAFFDLIELAQQVI